MRNNKRFGAYIDFACGIAGPTYRAEGIQLT